MNTTATTKSTKRLTLTRETLRTLTKDELRLVAGGMCAGTNEGTGCTRRASGCTG